LLDNLIVNCPPVPGAITLSVLFDATSVSEVVVSASFNVSNKLNVNALVTALSLI
jgi:hypothetical protein